jgi:acetyl esterase/lipase
MFNRLNRVQLFPATQGVFPALFHFGQKDLLRVDVVMVHEKERSGGVPKRAFRLDDFGANLDGFPLPSGPFVREGDFATVVLLMAVAP